MSASALSTSAALNASGEIVTLMPSEAEAAAPTASSTAVADFTLDTVGAVGTRINGLSTDKTSMSRTPLRREMSAPELNRFYFAANAMASNCACGDSSFMALPSCTLAMLKLPCKLANDDCRLLIRAWR